SYNLTCIRAPSRTFLNPRRSAPTCPHFFFFSSRRGHTRFKCDWSSDVCFPISDGAIRAHPVDCYRVAYAGVLGEGERAEWLGVVAQAEEGVALVGLVRICHSAYLNAASLYVRRSEERRVGKGLGALGTGGSRDE